MSFDGCTGYAADLLFVALVLVIFGVASLIYSAIVARRTALGDLLLEACAGDYETAAKAIENVRADNAAMAESLGLVGASYRRRVQRFHDEDVR